MELPNITHMGGNPAENTVKWQLCYDMTAKTWWMREIKEHRRVRKEYRKEIQKESEDRMKETVKKEIISEGERHKQRASEKGKRKRREKPRRDEKRDVEERKKVNKIRDTGDRERVREDHCPERPVRLAGRNVSNCSPKSWNSRITLHNTVFLVFTDGPEFQESFITSGVFNVTELVQVSRTPVVTGTGPNFSLGELQGHLAYDLNPTGVAMRRTLPSTSSSGSKRQKSSSVEGDIDTSPGGEYYASPNSPASSSRNWQDEMEGGMSPTVKKTEMDSPSPQESSPRLGSFTQHHRPVIAVHSGISRSPHPSSSLHFSTTPILPQSTSTYFPHTAIRYPPHLSTQDPLKDLVSLACDPSNQQPSPLNGSGQVKVPPHYISSQMLAPPPPPALPRLTLPPDSKSSTTSADAASSSPTSPTYSAPGTPPANRSFVGIASRDPASLYQAQVLNHHTELYLTSFLILILLEFYYGYKMYYCFIPKC
uniref:Nuclear factor I/C n=1 Tax=Astyanax mexicanus TaxID=7994 RepID=A0A8B9I0C6_ASTMX